MNFPSHGPGRRHRFMLRVGTAVLALVIAAPVFAQAPVAKVSPEVQKHFTLGNDYYQEGKYANALAEYDQAYDLSLDEKGHKNWKILYNRGQCLVMLGREPEAIDSFQRYLDEGADQIDSARRTQVEADIKKLRDRLGTMVLEGTAPTGADVFLDGRFMGKMPLPGPIVAASGFHDLVIKPAGGGTPYVATVKILAGQQVAHRVVMTASGPTPVPAAPYVDTPPPPPPPPATLPPRAPGGLTAPSWMLGLQLGTSIPMQDYRYGSSNGLVAGELSVSWRPNGFWELGIFGGFAGGSYTLNDSVIYTGDRSGGQLEIDTNASYTNGILGGRARMHLVRSKRFDGWLGVDFGVWSETYRFTGAQKFKYSASSAAFAIGFGADYALSERWALGLGMRFLQANASNGKRSECDGKPITAGSNGDYCPIGFLPGEGAGGTEQSTSRGFVELGLRVVYLIPTGEAAKPPAPPASKPVTASGSSSLF